MKVGDSVSPSPFIPLDYWGRLFKWLDMFTKSNVPHDCVRVIVKRACITPIIVPWLLCQFPSFTVCLPFVVEVHALPGVTWQTGLIFECPFQRGWKPPRQVTLTLYGSLLCVCIWLTIEYLFTSSLSYDMRYVFICLITDWRVAWRSSEVPLQQVSGVLLWNTWNVS